MRNSRSRFATAAREESYARQLERAQDHVCVAWTGVDTAGSKYCPGFTWSEERGLLAYIVPLVVMKEERLIPGFYGTPRQNDDPRFAGSEEDQPDPQADREAVLDRYMSLLRRYLRVVKITMEKETVDKFMPKNHEYLIVVSGVYERSIVGRIMAAPDKLRTGRFLVAKGVNPEAYAQIYNQPVAPVQTPVDPTTVPGAGQQDTIQTEPQVASPAERILKELQLYDATAPWNRVGAGAPAPGERKQERVEAESIKVQKKGSPPMGVNDSRILIEQVLNQDPARPIADIQQEPI